MNPYSSLKVFHHKESLDAIEENRKHSPIYIRLKPTNYCNHHCSYCTYGSGNTKEKTQNRDIVNHADNIPWKKMKEILCDASSMGVKAITFSGGGEPLTYPHIVEAAWMVQESGMDLSLITNGQLLSDLRAEAFRSAKWVRVSFDSPEEKTYMGLRGVSADAFQQVKKNIHDFAMHKETECTLGINFVISKANYRQVYDAAHILKELGADNIKFTAMDGNIPNYHDSIKDDVISLIQQAQEDFQDESFVVINNYKNDWKEKNASTQRFSVCYVCRLVTVIAADQKVYFCHTRAYDSRAIVGDLHSQSFRNMWFSEETEKRIQSISPMEDCRNFCAYQERNQLIQKYFDVDENHLNFI